MKTTCSDTLNYTLKRSNRKSLGLSIERDGAVIVRAPFKAGDEEIEKFISEKRIWIQQKLSRKQSVTREKPAREFVNGQGFLYLGKSYRLRLLNNDEFILGEDRNGAALHLRYGHFELPESEKRNAQRHFIAWYKHKTEKKLSERIPRYDKRLGIKVEKYKISDLGHRWASHSGTGIININWRTIMAPIWVFDYILVHEMSHMIERPHSKKFWRIVARVIPDYEEHIHWLSENGVELDL